MKDAEHRLAAMLPRDLRGLLAESDGVFGAYGLALIWPWSTDIFAWEHEDDSRTWVAPSLGSYLEWWADGRIRL